MTTAGKSKGLAFFPLFGLIFYKIKESGRTMRLKGDQSTTRALNRRLVLNQIRHDGPLSRAAITAAVGLSPAGVTFVTAELIAEGLLVEREALLGASGRRPVPLDIDYSSKLSIGLKVMVECVIGVITDLATRVIAETQIALPDSRPETVVKVSARVAERLLSQAKVNRSRVIGIGLTLAGQVDAEEGVCRQMQRFGWRDVPIAAMLADVVSVPVWVDNDANAFAVAQHLFGSARGLQSIAAIAMGRGVGAGLVVHGRLYRGGSGAAGEFGHNFDQRGRHCECGREGCIESYCSDTGLVQSWNELDPTTLGKTADQLAEEAEAGDSIARRVLSEAGTRLGRHIAALVNVFNPEMIVFGGEGLRFAGYLFDPIRKVLDEVCYPGAPPIAFDWERNSWQRGAAALAIQHFFNFEATGGFTPTNTKPKVARSNRVNRRLQDAERLEASRT
jgi:predicted NBD/HSP70 family sugar kinase